MKCEYQKLMSLLIEFMKNLQWRNHIKLYEFDREYSRVDKISVHEYYDPKDSVIHL